MEEIASAAHAARRPRLLVVEDDGGVRKVLRAALIHYGFEVRLAAGGPEAVEDYRRHRSSIDLVLLDVEMPGRDGPTILGDLREIDLEVRACFMSGSGGRYTVQNLVDCGALAIFHKPFFLLQLATRLRELLGPGTGERDRPTAFSRVRQEFAEVDSADP